MCNKRLSQRTAVTSTAHVVGSTDTPSSSSSTGTSTTSLTTVATATKVIGATHTTASVGGATARVAAAAEIVGATDTTTSVGAQLPCVAAAAKVVGAADVACCMTAQISVCCRRVSLQLVLLSCSPVHFDATTCGLLAEKDFTRVQQPPATCQQRKTVHRCSNPL